MSTILVGQFTAQSNKKEIEKDLESTGLTENDFVVYVQGEDSEFIVSAKVANEAQKDSIKNIYEQNKASGVYDFAHMNFESTSYKDIKEGIKVRAKAQIKDVGGINKPNVDHGIDDEVNI